MPELTSHSSVYSISGTPTSGSRTFGRSTVSGRKLCGVAILNCSGWPVCARSSNALQHAVIGTCVKLSASTTAVSCSLGLASRSLLNRAGIAMLRTRTEQSAVRVLLQLTGHRTLYTLLRLKPCR